MWPAELARLGASDADLVLLARLEEATAPRGSADVRPRESWPVRLAVLLLAPLWLAAIALAVLVRLVRGRLPAIAIHERAGYRCRRLLVPKVATTSVSTNRRQWGGLVEVATGPSVDLIIEKRPERWLRHSGIDELPQLALVVAGRMRIVGPRPATFEELAELGGDDAPVDFALDVLHPGLLGVWQVLDRHSYSFEQRCALDHFMIEHWSPALQRCVVRIAGGQAVRRLFGR